MGMAHVQLMLGAIAVLMTIWAHIPYLIKTLAGKNKPHIFTWVIWTLLTSIAAYAQFVGNAGPGAWATIITAIICLVITLATLKHGERNITHSDWIMFIGGCLAIPVWILTNDPIAAIIIVTLIDCSAFYPTFRKAWLKPHEEDSFMYGFNVPRHMISLTAINHFSLVTALYPAALLAMNVIMYVMLKFRRSQLRITV